MLTEPELRLDCKPKPLSRLNEVAPDTVQDRVELWPDVMEEGEAPKAVMFGRQAGVVVGVTTTAWVEVEVKST